MIPTCPSSYDMRHMHPRVGHFGDRGSHNISDLTSSRTNYSYRNVVAGLILAALIAW